MLKRNVLAILSRNGKYVNQRNYVRVQNAIRRSTERAFIDGEPGDVIELSHARTGIQIGTIKLSVGNKLYAQWTTFAKGEPFHHV